MSVIYVESSLISLKDDATRKNMEASIIELKRPWFNKQFESKKLILFQNGVTCQFMSFYLQLYIKLLT